MTTPMPASASRSLLAERWAAFSPRERVLVVAMSVALVVLVLWLVGVRPAWKTLSQAPALRAQVDAQALQLQALAGEARQLRALPAVSSAQAEQALKSATQRLGAHASLSTQPDRATLTVKEITGEDLRQWLSEARSSARARPIELQLTRSGDTYTGTLVVALGPVAP